MATLFLDPARFRLLFGCYGGFNSLIARNIPLIR